MAEKKIQSQFYTVKAPFFYKNDQLFTAGMVVEADHPVRKGRESLFQPLTPVGRAPAQPAPEPEPVAAAPVAETEVEPAVETDAPS